jgi:DNA polymerase-3 subunit delta
LPTVKFDEIVKDLRNKVYHPVYFLQGEETYYIDELSELFATKVLDEMEREFNQTIVYGKEIDVLSLLSTAKRFPMMSNYQVVMVREAQDLKVFSKKDKYDGDDAKKSEAEILTEYIKNPVKSTLLIFCYKHKTIDKRSKLAKAIEHSGQFFTSEPLRDYQIAAWIEKYLKERGHKISERAAALTGEYLGTQLSKITNELGKMLINLPEKSSIDVEQVEKFIGVSREYNSFELNNALNKKDVLKANRIINYFAANPKNNPMVVVLGSLFSNYNRLLLYHTAESKDDKTLAGLLGVNPYFVKDYVQAARHYPFKKCINIISLLREYDMLSKGVNNNSTSEGELLKELVFKILH